MPSYSPQIAEAKRRARAAARTTGSSYQSELENAARSLGYAGWSDLLSGKPIQNGAEKHPVPREPGKDTAARPSRAWRSLKLSTPVWVVGFILLVCAEIALAGLLRQDENELVKSADFLKSEEKALATVLPGLEFAGIERVSYVTAWKISPERRRVYITIYDWRAIPESIRQNMSERYRDVPLVRFQGIVDCKAGLLQNPNLYSANDLVSPALRKITKDAPAEKLTEREVMVMCNDDTLRRTKEIESF